MDEAYGVVVSWLDKDYRVLTQGSAMDFPQRCVLMFGILKAILDDFEPIESTDGTTTG